MPFPQGAGIKTRTDETSKQLSLVAKGPVVSILKDRKDIQSVRLPVPYELWVLV